MKKCLLHKWYAVIGIFMVFGGLYAFIVSSNKQQYFECSMNIEKQETCKTFLEKNLFDKIISENSEEKIHTGKTLKNGSKSYGILDKYSIYGGFILGLVATLIIFILIGLKFLLGLGKVKDINIISILVGYSLLLLLGLNFNYWEPRYTEIAVGTVFFIGKPLITCSFYILLVVLIMFAVKIGLTLFSKKSKNEENN